MSYIAEEYPMDLGDDLNWVVREVVHNAYVEFEIHEGRTWPDSDMPCATLDVTVWRPRRGHGGEVVGPEISWPSTSDKRPVLARALAVALEAAADYADTLTDADAEED